MVNTYYIIFKLDVKENYRCIGCDEYADYTLKRYVNLPPAQGVLIDELNICQECFQKRFIRLDLALEERRV